MKREDFEALGTKHKRFERISVDRDLMPNTPFVARLDGRAFHSFTKGLQRPVDHAFRACMENTAKYLVKEFHAAIAYTQSDEISLVFPNDSPKGEMLFGGNIQKLCSVFAAAASVQFNKEVTVYLPEKVNRSPILDCRVYSYPTLELCSEYLLWREADATRNSLTMLAQAHYSHKQLHGVGFNGKHDLLHAKGINWNDYSPMFKRGVYYRRQSIEMLLGPAELALIPEKHRPTGPVIRTAVIALQLPVLSTITNPVDALFGSGIIKVAYEE